METPENGSKELQELVVVNIDEFLCRHHNQLAANPGKLRPLPFEISRGMEVIKWLRRRLVKECGPGRRFRHVRQRKLNLIAAGDDKAAALPPLCESCGQYRSDPPSRLCPGCEAYQDHLR